MPRLGFNTGKNFTITGVQHDFRLTVCPDSVGYVLGIHNRINAATLSGGDWTTLGNVKTSNSTA